MRTTTTPSGSSGSLIAGTVPGTGCTVAGVRVISGSARGRRLVAPEGSGTRPTPDRVREATFNALGSLGAVDEAAVLDLFAGSGAMGIEALSRGAARATFVDSDLAGSPRHRGEPGQLRAVGSRGGRGGPVERFLAGAQQRRGTWPSSIRPTTTTGGPSCSSTCRLRLAVLESNRAVDPPFGWEVVRSKRYGRTHVVIATRIAV